YENIISVSKIRPPEYKSEHHFLDLSRPINEEDVREITDHIDVIDGLIWSPGVELFGMFQDTDVKAMDEQYNIAIRSIIIFIKVNITFWTCRVRSMKRTSVKLQITLM